MVMDRGIYLGYIAHFVSQVDLLASKYTYRDFFTKYLGSSTFQKAPDSKIRDLARHLYRAYVASLYSRYGACYLATRLTSTQLEEFIRDENALSEKYGIFYKVVDYDLSTSNIDKHIEDDAIRDYKSVLEEISSIGVAPVKRVAAKSAKRASVKSAKTLDVKTSKVKSAKPKTEEAPKRTRRTCDQYLLPELKALAKKKGITVGKLKKDQLCAKMKIRIVPKLTS